jgi:hypothetical protein
MNSDLLNHSGFLAARRNIYEPYFLYSINVLCCPVQVFNNHYPVTTATPYLSICLSVRPSIHLSSCCSHFEHRASVKSFVPLQVLNLRLSVGLLGRGISPTQDHYLHRTTKTQNKHTDIHALSGIRTYDPSVRASEDISCLRPRDNCDRLLPPSQF